MKKIIAVDFDGCLCEKKWPEIGEAHQEVIQALLKQKAGGAKLILWTCREGQLLQAAVMWCVRHGLRFDAINDNIEEYKKRFGNNCRKVWASEYWDEKSVIVIHTEDTTKIVCSNHYDEKLIIQQWKREDAEKPFRALGTRKISQARILRFRQKEIHKAP